MKIGLCWCGSRGHKNDFNRSIPFEVIRALGDVPGVQWQSLVIGDREDEATDAPWLERAGTKFPSFESTGLAMQEFDLVITVDTAVAHLAGALGVRAWVLVPIVPDFRWQLLRTDSPWYPTLRLYRQSIPGDWSHVVAEVIKALTELEVEA